jgi:hypothetical protein
LSVYALASSTAVYSYTVVEIHKVVETHLGNSMEAVKIQRSTGVTRVNVELEKIDEIINTTGVIIVIIVFTTRVIIIVTADVIITTGVIIYGSDLQLDSLHRRRKQFHR